MCDCLIKDTISVINIFLSSSTATGEDFKSANSFHSHQLLNKSLKQFFLLHDQ